MQKKSEQKIQNGKKLKQKKEKNYYVRKRGLS